VVPLRSPLRPGVTSVVIAGDPAIVRVQTENSGGLSWPHTITIRSSDFTMRLSSIGADGRITPLSAESALILESRGLATRRNRPAQDVDGLARVHVAGTGFQPDSQVRVYVLPNWYLGAIPTDASGVLEGSLPVPSGLPAGRYTLQTNGYTPDGTVRSVSTGVVVLQSKARALVKSKEFTFFFRKGSAALTPRARQNLARIAKRFGPRIYAVAVDGYVQRDANPANDRALSLARARAVADFLRSHDVRGDIVPTGRGVATAAGADGRRVRVVIRYVASPR
jgi:outer membrane protein OmpA-like peptidoglycan-associated protein